MQCVNPIYLWKRRTDSSEPAPAVPCGRCGNCLQNRRADWAFRLEAEQRVSLRSDFLTFTYDEKHIPLSDADPENAYPLISSHLGLELQSLRKTDFQSFIQDLRNFQRKYSNLSVRYYAVGEYGSNTYRPHYHGIFFNLHNTVVNCLRSIWERGHVDIQPVTPASIMYVTKYIISKKVTDSPGREPPFNLISRRPGLGETYVTSHNKYHNDNKQPYLPTSTGTLRLPRYYKERIFSPFQRELFSLIASVEQDERENQSLLEISRTNPNPYEIITAQKHQRNEKILNSCKDDKL